MKKIPYTRREFLRFGGAGFGLLAFNAYAPAFLTRSVLNGQPLPEKDRSILVIIQLAGGNDGLNTVIPFEDSHYYNLRPTLALKKKDILPLADELGLHPSLKGLADLYNSGKLSILQNVGYPNPNRSHFRSTEIWETASDSDQFEHYGWMGKFFDHSCCGLDPDTPRAVYVGNETPQSFLSNELHAIQGIQARGGLYRNVNEEVNELLNHALQQPAGDDPNFNFLEHTYFNALATEERVLNILRSSRDNQKYPGNNFAQSLKNIADLIAGGLETRVYFANLPGFDTHANQANNHSNLLATLSDGLAAFQEDLMRRGLEDQVLTMTFSEFGRRPDENGNRGTDHGTSAPLFIVGKPTSAGLFGNLPDLSGDPRAPTPFDFDFRQVYATLLEGWLGADSKAILGQNFKPISFL